MIRLTVTVIIGVLCLFPSFGFAAGFDCAKAASIVEKLICSDAELSKTDEELSAVYAETLASSANQGELKKEQMNWMRKDRDPCRTKECVSEAYKSRIEVLSGPSPVEEFYLEEPLTILSASGRQDNDFGNYSVCVKVHGKPSAPLVDFSVYFPDSKQEVSATNVRARGSIEAGLQFSFTDNWGNRGKGTFEAAGETYTLDLEETRPLKDAGWGRNALRNYGTYEELTRQKCGSSEGS